jgi:sugar phosphate isomerase/epimerase
MKAGTYPRIRIGTIARIADGDVTSYIRQIQPHGFETYQLQFWESMHGVDLTKLAPQVNEVLAGTGCEISALAVFGNPLGDRPGDEETLNGIKSAIDHAGLFGCNLVTGFTGRVRDEPIEESLPRYKEIWGDLARRAEDKGVRIAFENCPMAGTWQSGDFNIAHNPAAWELMFNELPSDTIGLEWEPCHQMVQLIDPLPQIREWGGKIFHVHGKCAEVKWDIIRDHGIHGRDKWGFHRMPGFGDLDWTKVISELRLVGYEGSIDIEGWHDPVYRGELEMTGQVHALNYLKRCRATYVPNPA